MHPLHFFVVIQHPHVFKLSWEGNISRFIDMSRYP